MGNLDWLTPLGFIGLISIAVLILIYILKPNYQKKIISSTFVWKLSLKYKRKRLPISQLRNIIIIICQILILATSTLILAQPFLDAKGEELAVEKIVVLDASANMLCIQKNSKTRFENAVLEIKQLASETILLNGHVTVILSKAEPSYAVLRSNDIDYIREKLDELIKPTIINEPSGCTLEVANIDKAMIMAEDLLAMYPSADVIFFTGKEYNVKGKVQVENVSQSEWNAAILSCDAFVEDNYYVFEVAVANYNAVRDMNLVIQLEARHCNGEENNNFVAELIAECRNNQPEIIRFDQNVFEKKGGIFSFEDVYICIKDSLADESFIYDNHIYIYGGEKPSIKVLYVSPEPTVYIRGAINDIRLNREFERFWNIDLFQTDLETYDSGELEPADFYIFEHEMPLHIPVDGVVMLINPNSAPDNAGIIFGDFIMKSSVTMDNFPLNAPQSHQILSYVDANKLNISGYRSLVNYKDYQPIINCSGEPVFLIKNQAKSKVIIMTFALQMSNIPLKLGVWPVMMANLFSYYFPPTTRTHLYEIGDTITLNARGTGLVMETPDELIDYTSLPAMAHLPTYGTYTIRQELINNDLQTERIFVKVAASESDFSTPIETFRIPYFPDTTKDINIYLLFFCALALVSLIFLEVGLHLRDQF